MDVMNLTLHCLLVFFTLCVREGLSEDYEAQPGGNILSQRTKRQSKPTRPMLKVMDYHVRCSVVSRYAVTTVQSSVWNQLPAIKEAAFEVDLPSSAFISNFTITSNGKVYVAQVKERAAARKIYDAAKKQGKTAGLVATKEREIEKFRVAVSVPSGARVSFSLTYEELIPRRLGRYELSLGLRPGQPVQNLTLDVDITERTGITSIRVLPLRTSRLLSNTVKADAEAPASTHLEQNAGCARVGYSPTLQQQNSISSKGLDADFIIQYDVELRDLIGDVQVYDGYFAHYFAPRGLPVVPKDVIFVIDVSGSMIGTKIKQTKQAMSTILTDLREGDHFNIITFSDKVHTWKKGRTVRATRQNVRDAKDFVKRIIAEGWTNINAALLSAAQLVNPTSVIQQSSRRVPLVIFLTDGEATIGVTAGDTILNNAKKALGSVSLFGLAFGDDADLMLLRRLALDNRGVARMVYEDADAALQLKGFYDEVASPLLSDIQLSYLDDQAFDVTCSLFPNYFQGSELVVAGRVKPGVKDLKVSLSAMDSKQRVKIENDVWIYNAVANETEALPTCFHGLEGVSSFVHRLWAYYTIKELLLAKLNTTDPAAQKLLTDKATNLSLKYNFVTPVTSLVVVKPDAEEAAQTATTTKPTTTATTTTTATSAATKLSSDDAARGHRAPSKSRLNKTKADSPQPPPKPPLIKKISAPTSTPKTPLRKSTTTSSSTIVKTAPAPLSSKKHNPSQNESKSAAPPSSPRSGKASTSLSNALKTAAPPAPGKVSIPPPNAMKTTTPSTPAPGKVSTPPPNTMKTTTPSPAPGKVSIPPPNTMKITTPSTPAPGKVSTPPPNAMKTTTPSTLAPGKVSTPPTNAMKTITPSTPAPGKVSTPPPKAMKNTTPSTPAPGKVSMPPPNTMKTTTSSTPAPGKVSTPPPNAMKTATPLAPALTTAPPLTSVRNDPAALSGRQLTPQSSTQKTALVPVKVTAASTESENSSTSAPDAGITSSLPPLSPPPSVEDNSTDVGVDTELSIATLVSATFAPMPGVTDGPRPWEAAGLLDVSTSIQIQRKDIDLVKDYDATYDYDFDINYDAWGDTADTGSFESPSRLSTVRVFSSSVDGDPHFVVQLPKQHQSLCFTVDGRADDVLRLVEDPEKGIIVDGHLIGAPSKHGTEERSRTYFDHLTISMPLGGSGGIMISISLDTVVVEGEGRDILPINQQASVQRRGVTVAVDNHRSCWIELAKHVRFLVLFHHYKHPSYLQMAHLGFYITDGQGLSTSTQGLLGQFQHTDMKVTVLKNHKAGGAHRAKRDPTLGRGLLRWGSSSSEHVAVTLQDKTLKDTARKRHLGKCWVVPKAEVQRLLGHPYESYVVDHV